MNAKNNSILKVITAAIVLIASIVPNVSASNAKEFNPYTVVGMQIRTKLLPETPGAEGVDLGPLVFQEIVPCRFVSTLEDDEYRNPWGPEAFQLDEARTYVPKGQMVAQDGWVNPCSRQVPTEALAVSLRVMSHGSINSNSVFFAPATTAPVAPTFVFKAPAHTMKEENVVLKNDAFTIGVDKPMHLTIDIIGYFLRDDGAFGAQGDRGDRGEKGDSGAQGVQGERGGKGEQGDRGENGAQGLQGARGGKGEQGDRGENGAQGLQGARGEKGEQGDRGEKGAQGLQGARGEKGEQGDRGEQGAQGLPGARGENGERGDRGEQGAQGLQGARGEKGERGDRGEQGAQGLQGARGEKGERGERGLDGAQGAMGLPGLQGAKGDKGDKGDKGEARISASQGGPYVFPPGGSLNIVDPAVTSNSFIILSYVEVSNGNALGIESQSRGSFVATGSPNKPFTYVVITPR
ncbi:MAG TPA: hypothetical protein VF883_24000 [Thermoanaerobaculia bacterium]|jgi:hypothetical protein